MGSAELTESVFLEAIGDMPVGHYVPLLEFAHFRAKPQPATASLYKGRLRKNLPRKGLGQQPCPRPEFLRMMDQLRAGDAVVVWRLGRLARFTRDMLDRMETIREIGGPVPVSFRAVGRHDHTRGEDDHDRVRRYCGV